MNTTTRPSYAPATARTWATLTRFTAYGESWGEVRHTVTLTLTSQGITAIVDGEEVSEAEAVGILRGADQLTVTAETLAPQLAPIGKARACELHRLMSRAGIPSGEHYGFAGAALDRPVHSLAALTEAHARQVWRFLCACFPGAAA